MPELTPEITAPEVSYPVYDNMPLGSSSHHPQNVQHHWRIRIDSVDQDERDRRWVESPMEQILANCAPYPPISHEQSLELVDRYRTGDLDAKAKLMLHFQRFVVWNAKQMYPQSKRLRMPMEDMIQEGMLGLMRSIEKVDPEKGRAQEGTIASYFRWYISNGMHRCLADKSRIIRLPANLHEKARDLVQVSSVLGAELGREPTTHEIAERAGMMPPKPPELMGRGGPEEEYDESSGPYPEYVINRAQRAHDEAVKKAVDDTEDILRAERPMISLDGFVLDRQGEERPLHEVAEDEAAGEEVIEQTFLSVLRDNLGDAVELLPDNYQTVIELRFGLDGSEPRTLEEVGRVLNVTRERIRQIEDKALKRLQHMTGLRSNDREELKLEGAYTPPLRTYIDHVSDTISAANRRGQTPGYWLNKEAEEVEWQRLEHLRREVAKRRAELVATAAEGNLEKLAQSYLSRCKNSSLYASTPEEEAKFIVNYQEDHKNRFIKRAAAKKILREYGGLAAYAALCLKSDEMSHEKAWEVARNTLFSAVRHLKVGDRLADIYCQAAEKAFARRPV